LNYTRLFQNTPLKENRGRTYSGVFFEKQPVF